MNLYRKWEIMIAQMLMYDWGLWELNILLNGETEPYKATNW